MLQNSLIIPTPERDEENHSNGSNSSIDFTFPITSAIPGNWRTCSSAQRIKQEKEHAYEVHCSRERSRAAWKIIEEYLMPFVERENYRISSKCRLHPDNDLFRDQEQHKVQVDINEWKCGYCKKSFRAEKYLDQHFVSRHYNLLNAMFRGKKHFPKGRKKQTSVIYLAMSILTSTLMPLFYLIVYLHQREMRQGTQELRRITRVGQKTKPS